MVISPGFLTLKDFYRISKIFFKIKNENVIKMKNKPDPALLRPSNLSNKIKKVSKSRETIPLKWHGGSLAGKLFIAPFPFKGNVQQKIIHISNITYILRQNVAVNRNKNRILLFVKLIFQTFEPNIPSKFIILNDLSLRFRVLRGLFVKNPSDKNLVILSHS
jgi:hypothetical protein